MITTTGPGQTISPDIQGFPTAPPGHSIPISFNGDFLAQSAAHLLDARGRLAGAVAATTEDWNGWAASRYRASAESLGGIINAAAEAMQEMADAVHNYAKGLDDVQSELFNLKQLYDAATKDAETAAGKYNDASARSQTHPDAAASLGKHQSDMNEAESEANGYVKKASGYLDDWATASAGYIKTLEENHDSSVRGFGVPVKDTQGRHAGVHIEQYLKQFDGTFYAGKDPLANKTSIPGFYQWDTHVHDGIQSTDDLTNLILLAAGPVEALGKLTVDALKPLSESALESLAKVLGVSTEDVTSSEGRGAILTALKSALTDPVDAYSLYSNLLDATVAKLAPVVKAIWVNEELRGKIVDFISTKLGLGPVNDASGGVFSDAINQGLDPEEWNSRATDALLKLKEWAPKLHLPASAVNQINRFLAQLAASGAKTEK